MLIDVSTFVGAYHFHLSEEKGFLPRFRIVPLLRRRRGRNRAGHWSGGVDSSSPRTSPGKPSSLSERGLLCKRDLR